MDAISKIFRLVASGMNCMMALAEHGKTLTLEVKELYLRLQQYVDDLLCHYFDGSFILAAE